MQVYLRLLGYVRPYWKIFLLSVLGYLLYSGTQPALAWMTGWLTDAIYNKDEMARYLIPLALLGIYLARGLGSFIGNYFLARVSLSVVRNLRTELFNKLIEFQTHLSNFRRHGP